MYNVVFNYHNRPYPEEKNRIETWWYSGYDGDDLAFNVVNPNVSGNQIRIGFDLTDACFDQKDEKALFQHFLRTLTAFVGASQWPRNRGHVIIIPNAHYENIFDLPAEYGTPIQRLAQALALAMKQAYRCDGISTRQHNEPAGNQDVWHYHLHVFPRYAGDNLYLSARKPMAASERAEYAACLRAGLARLAPGLQS